MIASRRFLLKTITSRTMRTAALSTRAVPSFHENVEQLLDPLGLDILNSPEVRQILAKQQQHKTETTEPRHSLPEQALFQLKQTTPFVANSGYDSDCEPMHNNWEKEMLDGSSIDEKRML